MVVLSRITSLMVNPKYESPKMMARGNILVAEQYFYVPFRSKDAGDRNRLLDYHRRPAGFPCSVLFSQRIETKEMGLNRQASERLFIWASTFFFRLDLGIRSEAQFGGYEIAYTAFTPVAKPGIRGDYTTI